MKIKSIVALCFCSLCSSYVYSQNKQDHLGQWLDEFISLESKPASSEEKSIMWDTQQGTLKGTKIDEISIFRSIRYAQAPTGNNRFAPPVPSEAWDGVKDATSFAPACMQAGQGNKSEDCLFLNVWTPAKHVDEKLPVYVFIHGGGFNMGAGSQALYDGKNLASQGVIVVTLNYRLGVFGFLPSNEAFKEHNTTGNWGVLDIIEALKWVKANISEFGGDVGKVTIGGESAGSFAVSALINSPLAKGLFQQAIMQSGSLPNAAAVAPFTASSLNQAQKLANDYLGLFNLRDDKDGLTALRQLPAEQILEKNLSFQDALMPQASNFWLVPDGYVYDSEPSNKIKAGEINQVNLLAGYNTNEGSLFISPSATENDYRTLLRTTFSEKADAVYARYPVTVANPVRKQMDRVITLSMLRSGMYQYADTLSKRNNVYLYNFDFTDPMIKPSGLGVIHGSELRYVFHNFMDFIDADIQASDMANLMQTAWANFIKTGNPNTGDQLLLDSTWEKYTTTSRKELTLTTEPTMADVNDYEDISFFNLVVPTQK